METEGALLLTCLIMLVGAYVAGVIPLASNFTKTNNNVISALGAGLLVGAGLCLVLPEGFVQFMEAQHAEGAQQLPEWLMGLSVLLGFLAMMSLQALSDYAGHEQTKQLGHSKCYIHGKPVHEGHQACGGSCSEASVLVSVVLEQSDDGDVEQRKERAPLLGHGHASVQGHQCTMSSLQPQEANSPAQQALWGLVIHSAADGLAVGAASLSGSLALSLSVAIAIVVHKGPVAFGLTSFLKSANWSSSRIFQGLSFFSIAAPAAALATYYLLGGLPLMQQPQYVALCVLFSGGTVLYAACVHILPSAVGQCMDRRTLLLLGASALVPLLVSALVPE